MMPSSRRLLLGTLTGAAYGLLLRRLGGDSGSAPEAYLQIMSVSFLLGVPFALGFLTLWHGDPMDGISWKRTLFAPWLSSFLFLAATLVLFWEGLICVVLWLPLTLGLSSLGGLFARLLDRLVRRRSSRMYSLGLMALLPLAAAPLERLKTESVEIRTVRSVIDIRAPREAVWKQIRSVPRIRESEHGFSWVHALGFPRPVEAVIDRDGVGAVRLARFEGNVLFVETVTQWRENELLSFAIQADTRNIPPTTFDEHVTVGGPYFDVLEGSYRLESLGPNLTRLHLSSDQRLSTRFNFYSHLWTEALMKDLQDYILEIVRRRSEGRA